MTRPVHDRRETMVGDEPYAPSVRLGPRKRATEELGATVQRRLDTDLDAVGAKRLPEMERHAVAWRLLWQGEPEDARYFASFEAGYAWGEQAEIFLVGPKRLHDQIEQVAGKYRELVDLQSAGPLDKAAAGAPVHVADVFIPVVLGIKDGQFITNAQTNPYASAEEAFRARLRTSRWPTAAMRRSSKRMCRRRSPPSTQAPCSTPSKRSLSLLFDGALG
jgi:hypothetical protein